MTRIVEQIGYRTDDGEMFDTFVDAANHIYGKELREVLKPNSASGVFGVKSLLDHSGDVGRILHEYNTAVAPHVVSLINNGDDRHENT